MTVLSRRWVLRGMGATVAIPVLPSLLGASDAAAQGMMEPRFFVNLGTHHGAAWERFMLPAVPTTGVTRQQYAGREIRSFPLTRALAGGEASLSPVLSAPEGRFTEALKNKMWVVRGFDIPWYLGHHTGGHLGNLARNDGNGGDGTTAQMNAVRPTIDQLMAWSSSFYPDLSGVRERVLVLSGRMSYAWQNPETRSGAIQEITSIADSPQALFRRLFPTTGATPRAPIVDRVLENYRRLRANPRLSRADRDRLDDHLQRLSELQRRLTSMATCGTPTAPAAPHATATLGAVTYNPPYARNPTEQAAWYRVMNDVVVAAFACGLSRLAVALINPHLSTYAGDWHQDVAHQADGADGMRQDVLWRSYNTFFKDIFLDLAAKLDAVSTGTGRTLLDQAMVCWTQESGPRTHDLRDAVVVGFGGAGGRLNTGLAVDYRNLNLRFEPASETNLVTRPGLLWQQWLGTVLQTMGIPKSEWERPAVNGGYPDYNFTNLQWQSINAATAWPQPVWGAAGERLPLLCGA
ncbi:MAG: DUF1552 domain-containing protein [Myxococcaceae bacterium]|nr:DUF1552 domain-containing protein [Myxococcaceae bacterium]